ncbi:10145_t:CDS:2, partial [Racocetra fulgida]
TYKFQQQILKEIDVVLYQSISKDFQPFEIGEIKENISLHDIQDTLDHFWSFYLNSPDQPWNRDETEDIMNYYDDETIIEINMQIIVQYIPLVREWLPIDDPNNAKRSNIAQFLDASYKLFSRIFEAAIFILDVGSSIIDYIFQQEYRTRIKAVWAALLMGLNKDEYTSIEFLQQRYDDMENMGIEIGGDGVILGQKEPIRLENADSRYSTSAIDLSPEHKILA